MEEYLGKRGRNEDHCIILGHGTLMEYDSNIVWFLENLVSIVKNCYFGDFIILSLLDFDLETSYKYI